MRAFGTDSRTEEPAVRQTWAIKCETCRKTALSFDGVRSHRHNCDCDLVANARARVIMGLPANSNFEAATPAQWKRLSKAVRLGGMHSRPIEEIVSALDSEEAVAAPVYGGLEAPIDSVLSRIELARSPDTPADPIPAAAPEADPPEFPEPGEAPEATPEAAAMPETAIHELPADSDSETEGQ